MTFSHHPLYIANFFKKLDSIITYCIIFKSSLNHCYIVNHIIKFSDMAQNKYDSDVRIVRQMDRFAWKGWQLQWQVMKFRTNR